MKVSSSTTPRFRADFAGLGFTPKSSMGNIERNSLHCRSFPIRRNSVLSGFSFGLFINIHDWTKAKNDCKPFSATAESPDGKGHIQLAIISTEMVRVSLSRDHAKWSGIEGKTQRT